MPNLWTLLINRWRLMGVALLAPLALTGLWIISQVALYTATATLLIEPPQSLVESLEAEDAQDRYYQQQVDLLRSPAFATLVVTNLNLESSTAFAEAQNKATRLERLKTQVFRRLSVLLTYSSYLFGAAPHSPSDSSKNARGDSGRLSDIVAHYLELLTVTPDPYTYATEVSFSTPDPALSQELADAHATTFARTSDKTRIELTTEGRAFLSQQLATQEQRLTQAEAALQQFHQEYGDSAPPSKDNLIAQRLLNVHKRFTGATERRVEAETLYRLTEKKDAPQLVALIKNDRISQLRAAFSKIEAEHTRLTSMLSPSHPRLSELSTAKGVARENLDREFTSIVSKLEAEYRAALDAEAVLQGEVEQQRKAALDLGELGVVDATLAADVTAARTLSQNISKRQQKNAIVKTMAAPNIAVTAQAELPLSPSSPQPKRDLLLTLFGGMIIATGLALFVERMDMSIRTAQDVWQTTAYPLLGVIPPRASRLRSLLQKRKSAYHLTPAQSDSPKTATEPSVPISKDLISADDLRVEAYQALRAALPLGRKKSLHTILFTSPLSGEGKTTTVLNLATVLAWGGHKVAVVDADLRAGCCHRLLQRKRSPGLSEVLLEGASLASGRRRPKKDGVSAVRSTPEAPPTEYQRGDGDDDQQEMRPLQQLKALVETAVQTTTVEGLSLVACGQVWTDPTEQLVSRTMQEVLSILRRQFDYVLIDSPAAITYGDAEFLAQLSDATVLVVRGYKTPMAAAHRIAGQLQAVRANVLGVVLTGVTPDGTNATDYR